jgi:hypothetical protein
VKIAFYNGNTRTSTFDVLTGTDGVNWATAATGLVSSGTSLNLETFTFTARTAKYVRIVGHGNSVNAWNSYTEISIQTGSSAARTSKTGQPDNTTPAAALISFPNPFTDQATISFTLPKAGNTRLTVYDMHGKTVNVLVNAHLPAGTHQVQLKAGEVPAGVYMLQLNYNGKASTRKLQKL